MTEEKKLSCQVIANYKLRKKNLETKRYHCEKCSLSFRDVVYLNNHLNSKKHNNTYVKYECECCNYTTNLKSKYKRHCNSKKHTKNIMNRVSIVVL